MKDTSDPDWWIGQVDGYTGYFPHRYVLPLAAGQRVYQIVKPLHLSHGNNDIKLLRDQVTRYIFYYILLTAVISFKSVFYEESKKNIAKKRSWENF